MDLEASPSSGGSSNTQPCSLLFYNVPATQDLEELFQDHISMEGKKTESRK